MSSFVGDNIMIHSTDIIKIHIIAKIKQEKRTQKIRHDSGLSRHYTITIGKGNNGLPLSSDKYGRIKPSPLRKITNANDIAPILSIQPKLTFLLHWKPPQFAREGFSNITPIPIRQKSTDRGTKRQHLEPQT